MNEREPLLSDDMMSTDHFSTNAGGAYTSWTDHMSAHDVRDFYENLIKEGRLREVKKVKVTSFPTTTEAAVVRFCECQCGFMFMECLANFCPGCGNPIDTDTGDIPLGEELI